MITLEGWSTIMYNLGDASQTWMAQLFCILLVIIGSFFLLNVVLAVIMDAFDDVDRNAATEEQKKAKELADLKTQYGVIETEEEKEEEESPHHPCHAAARNEEELDTKRDEQLLPENESADCPDRALEEEEGNIKKSKVL